MFTRKQQLRWRRLLMWSALALVLNLIVPAMAKAQIVEPPDVVGNSHPVIVQPEPTVQPLASLSTLPEPTAKPIVVAKHLTVRASAYSSTVDQCDGSPFVTASGDHVHDGVIAMNGLPFGTKIRIPSHYGDKAFTVIDRMNAKWGNSRIDIWMTTRAAAVQWGVRTVQIEILAN